MALNSNYRLIQEKTSCPKKSKTNDENRTDHLREETKFNFVFEIEFGHKLKIKLQYVPADKPKQIANY